MAGEALQEVFAAFGFKFDAAKLNALQNRVERVTNDIRGLGQIMAGAFMVRQVARFVDRTRAIGDELDKTSQQLGLSTRDLQEWRHVAELGGVDGASFARALAQVQQNAVRAANGGQEAQRAFRQMGVEWRDQSGTLRSVDQIMLDISDSLMRNENATQRVGYSMQLMGETGQRLLPALTLGADAIREQRRELNELGGGASPQMVRASTELTDTMTRWRVVLMGLRSNLAVAFLPIINKVTEALTKVGAYIVRLTKDSHSFKVALALLGVAAVVAAVKFAAAWAAALWPLALGAAAIGLVVLAIDDVIVTLQGGNSMIQAFIDELFGVGTTAGVLATLQGAWEIIVADIREAWEAVSGFGEAVADTYRLLTTGSAESASERHDRETRERQQRIWARARQQAAAAEGPAPRQRGQRRGPARRSGEAQATGPGQDTPRRRRNARAGAGPEAPQTVRLREVRQVTVNAPAEVSVNITAQGADANAVARVAAQRVRRELARERRQTVAALEAAEGGS